MTIEEQINELDTVVAHLDEQIKGKIVQWHEAKQRGKESDANRLWAELEFLKLQRMQEAHKQTVATLTYTMATATSTAMNKIAGQLIMGGVKK